LQNRFVEVAVKREDDVHCRVVNALEINVEEIKCRYGMGGRGCHTEGYSPGRGYVLSPADLLFRREIKKDI
jgi:hypothetical protein